MPLLSTKKYAERAQLNAKSSRSHAVLAIKVAVNSVDRTRISTASAIDLAGSEDNRRTENGKERMVESAAINRSLFTLAKCVEAISQKQSRIPYRESKMTRILSLGQNDGLTIMILNLAPTRSYHLDTLSSLNFANRTKKIEVRETENEPIFKGCARAPAIGTGEAVKRQPLRPITNTLHNTAVGMAKAPSGQSQKLKAFAVFSDRQRLSGETHQQGSKGHSPHFRHTAASSLPTIRHSVKRRSGPRSSNTDRAVLSKEAIEDLIERKVADALAARALDQPTTNVEPEISQEVQRRLDAIEQKIEGQHGSSREEGLSFLLCAKQHAVRGEHRSALKMYLLAKQYFPDNFKLDQKIEKLRNKLERADRSEEAHAGRHRTIPRLNNKRHGEPPIDEDDDYQEDAEDAQPCDESEVERARPRKRKRTRAASSMDEDHEALVSPGTQCLLEIIHSGDLARISGLRGVGAKRAMSIIEAFNDPTSTSVRSLAHLARLKGVGARTVEKMRAGLQCSGDA